MLFRVTVEGRDANPAILLVKGATTVGELRTRIESKFPDVTLSGDSVSVTLSGASTTMPGELPLDEESASSTLESLGFGKGAVDAVVCPVSVNNRLASSHGPLMLDEDTENTDVTEETDAPSGVDGSGFDWSSSGREGKRTPSRLGDSERKLSFIVSDGSRTRKSRRSTNLTLSSSLSRSSSLRSSPAGTALGVARIPETLTAHESLSNRTAPPLPTGHSEAEPWLGTDRDQYAQDIEAVFGKTKGRRGVRVLCCVKVKMAAGATSPMLQWVTQVEGVRERERERENEGQASQATPRRTAKPKAAPLSVSYYLVVAREMTGAYSLFVTRHNTRARAGASPWEFVSGFPLTLSFSHALSPVSNADTGLTLCLDGLEVVCVCPKVQQERLTGCLAYALNANLGAQGEGEEGGLDPKVSTLVRRLASVDFAMHPCGTPRPTEAERSPAETLVSKYIDTDVYTAEPVLSLVEREAPLPGTTTPLTLSLLETSMDVGQAVESVKAVPEGDAAADALHHAFRCVYMGLEQPRARICAILASMVERERARVALDATSSTPSTPTTYATATPLDRLLYLVEGAATHPAPCPPAIMRQLTGALSTHQGEAEGAALYPAALLADLSLLQHLTLSLQAEGERERERESHSTPLAHQGGDTFGERRESKARHWREALPAEAYHHPCLTQGPAKAASTAAHTSSLSLFGGEGLYIASVCYRDPESEAEAEAAAQRRLEAGEEVATAAIPPPHPSVSSCDDLSVLLNTDGDSVPHTRVEGVSLVDPETGTELLSHPLFTETVAHIANMSLGSKGGEGWDEFCTRVMALGAEEEEEEGEKERETEMEEEKDEAQRQAEELEMAAKQREAHAAKIRSFALKGVQGVITAINTLRETEAARETASVTLSPTSSGLGWLFPTPVPMLGNTSCPCLCFVREYAPTPTPTLSSEAAPATPASPSAPTPFAMDSGAWMDMETLEQTMNRGALKGSALPSPLSGLDVDVGGRRMLSGLALAERSARLLNMRRQGEAEGVAVPHLLAPGTYLAVVAVGSAEGEGEGERGAQCMLTSRASPFLPPLAPLSPSASLSPLDRLHLTQDERVQLRQVRARLQEGLRPFGWHETSTLEERVEAALSALRDEVADVLDPSVLSLSLLYDVRTVSLDMAGRVELIVLALPLSIPMGAGPRAISGKHHCLRPVSEVEALLRNAVLQPLDTMHTSESMADTPLSAYMAQGVEGGVGGAYPLASMMYHRPVLNWLIGHGGAITEEVERTLPQGVTSDVDVSALVGERVAEDTARAWDCLREREAPLWEQCLSLVTPYLSKGEISRARVRFGLEPPTPASPSSASLDTLDHLESSLDTIVEGVEGVVPVPEERERERDWVKDAFVVEGDSRRSSRRESVMSTRESSYAALPVSGLATSAAGAAMSIQPVHRVRCPSPPRMRLEVTYALEDLTGPPGPDEIQEDDTHYDSPANILSRAMEDMTREIVECALIQSVDDVQLSDATCHIMDMVDVVDTLDVVSWIYAQRLAHDKVEREREALIQNVDQVFAAEVATEPSPVEEELEAPPTSYAPQIYELANRYAGLLTLCDAVLSCFDSAKEAQDLKTSTDDMIRAQGFRVVESQRLVKDRQRKIDVLEKQFAREERVAAKERREAEREREREEAKRRKEGDVGTPTMKVSLVDLLRATNGAEGEREKSAPEDVPEEFTTAPAEEEGERETEASESSESSVPHAHTVLEVVAGGELKLSEL
ncbi:hypothetical protein KIPB_003302 [Kipferlia bialata]|uniref:Uncharacterized protein n=1 Tax=Kipferlia bialata TaxID=797122 RepID=A0A9K3CT74_9EUKA|nr:hypothetical protein KIPB_003302 [Kipferlia bialata]|eukprot:g3302.t1